MAKAKAKKTEKNVKKESFVKSVKKEMKLVKWPTWKDVIKNTIATVIMVLFIVAFFILLQLGLTAIKRWFGHV